MDNFYISFRFYQLFINIYFIFFHSFFLLLIKLNRKQMNRKKVNYKNKKIIKINIILKKL